MTKKVQEYNNKLKEVLIARSQCNEEREDALLDELDVIWYSLNASELQALENPGPEVDERFPFAPKGVKFC